MNALLDKTFLSEIGVELDEHTYELLAQHYQQTLMERIEDEIVAELDEALAVELSALKNLPDEALRVWLAGNVPQLREIIEDEIVILMGEIAENSEQI